MRATANRAFAWASAAAILFASSAHAQECAPLKVLADLDIVTDDASGMFAFPVLVQGTEKYFVAATSSATSRMNEAVLNELNIEIGVDTVEMIDTAGRRYRPLMARPDRLQIGTLWADHLPVQVDQGQGPDGSIGADILRNYDLEIDFANRKLRFIDRDHCAGYLPHWGDAQIESVAMDVTPVNGTPTIRVSVNGVRLDAEISLAAYSTAMNQTIARRRLDVDFDDEGVAEDGEMQGAGRTGTIYRTHFDTLEIGDLTVNNVEMQLLPDLLARSTQVTPTIGSMINRNPDAIGGLPDVILAMSVLRNFRVFMAYSEDRFYLSPVSPESTEMAGEEQPAAQ